MTGPVEPIYFLFRFDYSNWLTARILEEESEIREDIEVFEAQILQLVDFINTIRACVEDDYARTIVRIPKLNRAMRKIDGST